MSAAKQLDDLDRIIIGSIAAFVVIIAIVIGFCVVWLQQQYDNVDECEQQLSGEYIATGRYGSDLCIDDEGKIIKTY